MPDTGGSKGDTLEELLDLVEALGASRVRKPVLRRENLVGKGGVYAKVLDTLVDEDATLLVLHPKGLYPLIGGLMDKWFGWERLVRVAVRLDHATGRLAVAALMGRGGKRKLAALGTPDDIRDIILKTGWRAPYIMTNKRLCRVYEEAGYTCTVASTDTGKSYCICA